MATIIPKSFRLVTVNPQPERAKNVASKVIARLQDQYTITHVGNIDAEDKIATSVAELKPDVLFCASSWTAEESSRILAAAREARPGLRAYAVPNGLHNAGGPEAVVAHLADKVGELLK